MLFVRFYKDDRASTAVEYGLIASLITLAVLGGLQATGTSVEDMWTNGSNTINSVLGN